MMGTRGLEYDMVDHNMSDNENEEEITELVVKCYASDSEIEVSKNITEVEEGKNLQSY